MILFLGEFGLFRWVQLAPWSYLLNFVTIPRCCLIGMGANHSSMVTAEKPTLTKRKSKIEESNEETVGNFCV